MPRKPSTPQQRGAWPNKPGVMHFEDPVEVLVQLDQPTYKWLEEHTSSRAGSHPLTSSVEVAIGTLLRAAARKGITLEWLEHHIFVSGAYAPLRRPKVEGIGSITIEDLSIDGGVELDEFPKLPALCCDGTTNAVTNDSSPVECEVRRRPDSPRERGLWPAYAPINWNDPVEVLLTLERDIYEWMEMYLVCEAGASSFTGSFEETVDTLVRAAAQDGLTLSWVADAIFIPGCCEGVEPFEDCPNCDETHLEKHYSAAGE